jgi:hypothetical protein
MPKPRNRYGTNGRALPCGVKIPPPLAEVLYRERIARRYRDETELVVSIIREWASKLEAVEWASVLEALKREEEADAAAQDDAPPPKGKGKKK